MSVESRCTSCFTAFTEFSNLGERAHVTARVFAQRYAI